MKPAVVGAVVLLGAESVLVSPVTSRAFRWSSASCKRIEAALAAFRQAPLTRK